jgi:hypothetical protein
VSGERWRAVVGFEGAYEVSDHGRVRSLDRVINMRDGRQRRHEGIVLRASPNHHGYPTVSLRWNGKASEVNVHVLVAAAFLGDNSGAAEVNHIDGVKTNNRVVNLEWVPHADNLRHALATGLRTGRRGEQSPSAKLTEVDVHRIRRLAPTLTRVALAREYGVAPSTISRIVTGVRWKYHAQPEERTA